MKIAKLKELWDEFADIPVNNDDEIEIDFYWWEKGCCRFDIWHWFDEKSLQGVVELIRSQNSSKWN
jgi:hypothetical protein